MTTFPGSPAFLKGGIVLLDPDSIRDSARTAIIVLQYNPDTLTRTLKIKGVGRGGRPVRGAAPDRPTGRDDQARRRDRRDRPARISRAEPTPSQYGIFPQLAALETLVYPHQCDLQKNFALAQAGTLEIMPMLAPISLFVWSASAHRAGAHHRFQHHRGSFRPAAQSASAPRSAWACACSASTICSFADKGGSLYMAYQRQKENLAQLYQRGTLGQLGIRGLP